MIQRLKTYIETSDWEDKVPAWESLGNAISVAVMIFAAIYIGAGVLKAVLR